MAAIDIDVEKVSREISQANEETHPVTRHLQEQLANALVLYLNYKRYHWQAYGPNFRDLHKLFDELAKEVLESVDELAERLRMIGQDPIHDPAELASAASVRVSAGDELRDWVEEADANVLLVIKEMRQAVHDSTEAGDPGTADLFTRAVQVHEKHEWFLRELSAGRDDELTTH